MHHSAAFLAQSSWSALNWPFAKSLTDGRSDQSEHGYYVPLLLRPDDALNQKNEVWNVEHFMHSTVAALITSRKGWGDQTPIINDKINLYNSYILWLST